MAIVSLIERYVVTERKWLRRDELLNLLAIANLLPGPIAVNVAAATGFCVYGWKGLTAAWLALLLPAFISCLVLARLYGLVAESTMYSFFIAGMSLAVLALIVQTVYALSRSIVSDLLKLSIAVFGGGIYLLNPFGNALFSVALLYVGVLLWVSLKCLRSNVGGALKDLKQASCVVLPLGGVYLLLLVVNTLDLEYSNTNVDLVVNLSTTSLMLFGGAYSFIPIVGSLAVDERNWLSMDGFMNGVVIGQVSPGPVLITSAYIGYSLTGILGAVLATVALFLPPALIMVYVSDRLGRSSDNLVVQEVLRLLKPLIVGFLCAGVVQICFRLEFAIFDGRQWLAFIVLGTVLLALVLTKIKPIILILVTGTLFALYGVLH